MIGLDQDEMVRTLNLTKAGRLAEATELIQRTLGSPPAQNSGAPPFPKLGSLLDADRLNPLIGVKTLPGSFGGPQELRNLERTSLGQGVLLDRVYANSSGARRYKIYVPPDCPKQGAPVIVMLHGGTQPVLDYAAGTGMNPLADLHHFLVVYPEQDARANPMRYWNWFRPEDQHSGNGEPALIAGITEEVIAEYAADPKKVYIVGFSAGGAMAIVMAAAYPHLYAAAGVNSGLPYGAAHDVPSAFALMHGASPQLRSEMVLRIPLIVFHGDHDEIVNVINASYIRQQRLGPDGTLRTAHDVRVTEGKVPGGHAYTRTSYSDEAGVLLEQWIVHGAGHAWFGGTAGCSYTDPLGPTASAEMVRFFGADGRRG